jgi:hypothetical protein
VGTAALGCPVEQGSTGFCRQGITAGTISGWLAPSEEIWLSASQGLRGSIRSVVWRGDPNLVALETWPTDNEINKTDN